jgi:hypothetical protein
MRHQLPGPGYSFRLIYVLIPILVSLILINISLFIYLRSRLTSRVSPSQLTVLPTSPAIFPTATDQSPVSPTSFPPTPTLVVPTSQPLVSVPILSTSGWRPVSLDGISFLVPPAAVCKNGVTPPSVDDTHCRQIFFSSNQVIPQTIYVEPYIGASRRLQFLGDNPSIAKECRLKFVDSIFGSVRALQIANDGGWCQGGGGGIVAVIGSKFVSFSQLNYNSDNGEISRFPERDTIISTLTLRN